MYVANYTTTCSCTDGNIQLQLEHTPSLEDTWQQQSQALAAKDWNGVSCFAFQNPNSNSGEQGLPHPLQCFSRELLSRWLMPFCSVSPLSLQVMSSWDMARESIFILLVYFYGILKRNKIIIGVVQNNSLIPNAHKCVVPVFVKRKPFLAQSPSKGISRGNLDLPHLRLGAEEWIGKESQMFVDWKIREKALGSFGRDIRLACFFTACVFL